MAIIVMKDETVTHVFNYTLLTVVEYLLGNSLPIILPRVQSRNFFVIQVKM
jgi:hypothetical protein